MSGRKKRDLDRKIKSEDERASMEEECKRQYERELCVCGGRWTKLKRKHLNMFKNTLKL